MSKQEVTVWRPSMVVRTGLYVFAAYMVAMGVSIVVTTAEAEARPTLEGVVFAIVFAGGPACITVMWVHRSRIICSSVGVEVVNLLAHHQLTWDQIAYASPRFWGIKLHLRNGRTVHGRAVQQSELMVLLKQRTRADELADLINSALRQ